MTKFTSKFKAMLKDQAGQGATEYILLLVAVVAIAVMFGPQLKKVVESKTSELSSSIQGFKP